jgi:hypothetical protein
VVKGRKNKWERKRKAITIKLLILPSAVVSSFYDAYLIFCLFVLTYITDYRDDPNNTTKNRDGR